MAWKGFCPTALSNPLDLPLRVFEARLLSFFLVNFVLPACTSDVPLCQDALRFLQIAESLLWERSSCQIITVGLSVAMVWYLRRGRLRATRLLQLHLVHRGRTVDQTKTSLLPCAPVSDRVQIRRSTQRSAAILNASKAAVGTQATSWPSQYSLPN